MTETTAHVQDTTINMNTQHNEHSAAAIIEIAIALRANAEALNTLAGTIETQAYGMTGIRIGGDDD